MFEGDSSDTYAEKCTLVLMGGRAEGLACADPRARTPISASGNYNLFDTLPQDSKRGIAFNFINRCIFLTKSFLTEC